MAIGNRLALIFLAMLVAGCAHVRPAETRGCAYRAVPLLIGTQHPRGVLAPGQIAPPVDPFPFRTELTRSLSTQNRAAPPAGAPTSLEILVLSGGSQHGLFGTGFFLGMQHLPDYDVVTGVSTGSLQSTFLFLANDPVVARDYPADLGFDAVQIPRHSSNIADLALASSVTRESSLLKVGSFGIVGGIVRGAVASLEPLRARLLRFITLQTLQRVAAAADGPAHRKLYVGVTDLDDGNGYAIDLTELAQRIDDPAWASRPDILQACYVDALIASSSVPLAAYPVSLAIRDANDPTDAAIRHDLFIDGGARYGVFFSQIRDAAEAAGRPVNITMIVNGSLYSGDWHDAHGQPIVKWSALNVAARSVDILENQVYRFSVEDVERRGLSSGSLKMAFISNENLGPTAEQPEGHRFDGRSCAQWTIEDDKQAPVQFHPHYMACLLDYGRTRGAMLAWNVDRAAPGALPH